MFRRWVVMPLLTILVLALVLAGLGGIMAVIAYSKLEPLTKLSDYRPKIPLRVYTLDGEQIGEFGEERRQFVTIDKIPDVMKKAIIAAEDERFYTHSGVDYVGVVRAIFSNVSTGETRSSTSTITMQLAKNFYFTRERTFRRKFNEALMAFKIERNLSKDQILEIYCNQIYLGQRAYGFAAASQIYFSKNLEDISVAEAAMLAGLPKAPSTNNPVANLARATQRQHYVLRKMHELNLINDQQYEEAKKQPLQVRRFQQTFNVRAEHVSEMVRQLMIERYGDAAYTEGFKVYTTIQTEHQAAAYQALRKGVLEYDRRHAYRGAEAYVDLQGKSIDEVAETALEAHPDSNDLLAGVVANASPREVTAYLRDGSVVKVSGNGLKFAARALDSKANPATRIRPGSVIRVRRTGDANSNWEITQVPEVEAAFVSVDPSSGAIKSLIGGFDFGIRPFNHVTQAWRQPGSSFKPFIYSGALEKGFTAGTVINDSPFVINSGGQRWEPKNYDGTYGGPMRLRQALARSKNVISVRILDKITPQYAQEYITQFGFDADKHPPYLTMALGAGSVTAWQMAGAYSVFANGGYRVTPYFIEKIVDQQGNVTQANPPKAGETAEQVIDPRNAFIMYQMMKDVVRAGTATKAMKLGRNDLAGKTGTTNDHLDAWFAGYNPKLVGIAWIGFDQPKPMGAGETGGHTALPIWIYYMEKALKNTPQADMVKPEGVVQNGGEYFYEENQKTGSMPGVDGGTGTNGEDAGTSTDDVKNMIF